MSAKRCRCSSTKTFCFSIEGIAECCPFSQNGNEQTLDFRRARNLDFFIVESDDVALRTFPVRQCRETTEAVPARVILSSEFEALSVGWSFIRHCLKITPATAFTSLESFVPMPNPATSGNSATIFLTFSTVEIASEIRAQAGQAVRREETQTPLAELGEISRVDAKTFERAATRFG